VGKLVGAAIGTPLASVGTAVGLELGAHVGEEDGTNVGAKDGARVGAEGVDEGELLGAEDGGLNGASVGISLCERDGHMLGELLGTVDTCVGAEGKAVGAILEIVGASECAFVG